MKKDKILSSLTLLIAMLVLTGKVFALSYNVTFTGSGASSTVESVVVKNLTKGTTVTVPAGNTLNLTDGISAVEEVNVDDEFIRIYPNSLDGSSTVSFLSKQIGSTEINAFTVDGRKIIGTTANLEVGVNSFQVALPMGAYVVKVTGHGYSYSAKMISQTVYLKGAISYNGVKTNSNKVQKIKNTGISVMNFNAGDRFAL